MTKNEFAAWFLPIGNQENDLKHLLCLMMQSYYICKRLLNMTKNVKPNLTVFVGGLLMV